MTQTKYYNLTLTLADKVLKGKGETVLEALQSIKEPIKVFTKGDIVLKYGNKEMKQTWNPVKVRVMFRKLSQPILAKQFTYLLR